MSIEVTTRTDKQFPIGIELDPGVLQKLTLAAAKELHASLGDAIDHFTSVQVEHDGYCPVCGADVDVIFRGTLGEVRKCAGCPWSNATPVEESPKEKS